MKPSLVAAFFLVAIAGSLPLPAQGARTIGGALSMSEAEALIKADVVAFVLIDAGQLSPPLFHGRVTDPVKGVEAGAELCFTVAHPIALGIGREHLVFLFRTPSSPTARHTSVCSAGIPVLAQADAPGPLPVVTTFEVLPCPSPPCARSPYCANPPCVRPADTVRMSAAGFPTLTPVPAACPEWKGDTWVFRGSLLVAMRGRVAIR